MVEERAQIAVESERVRTEAWRLSLDQNASNAVLQRRHQTRLPLHYEPMNLFNTPGAGRSTQGARVNLQLNLDRLGSGAVAQPRHPKPTRRDERMPNRPQIKYHLSIS